MSRPVLYALLAFGAAASAAQAQGFYQSQLWRNPLTGRMEVVDRGSPYYGPMYQPQVTPYRDQRSFYGTRTNQYSGDMVQSQVRRNPLTGRLDVANEYYNPYTGARVVTERRFNPFTRRYENQVFVTPPTQAPADQTYGTAPEAEQSTRTVERPKVIETNPNVIDANPLLLPPVPPVAQDVNDAGDAPRGF